MLSQSQHFKADAKMSSKHGFICSKLKISSITDKYKDHTLCCNETARTTATTASNSKFFISSVSLFWLILLIWATWCLFTYTSTFSTDLNEASGALVYLKPIANSRTNSSWIYPKYLDTWSHTWMTRIHKCHVTSLRQVTSDNHYDWITLPKLNIFASYKSVCG